MRILIIGAGVTGSVYASQFMISKNKLEKKLKTPVEIKLLARGSSYKKIKNNGLRINHHLQKIITIDQIPVIDTLEAGDQYDFVLIFLRKTQVKVLLPLLSKNNSLNFVFIGNNGTGIDDYCNSISKQKIILGFPGVGGYREENKIYAVHKIKPQLTIGAAETRNRKTVRKLKKILKISRIHTITSNNMDSWLKYHIAIVSPLANAIYFDGGDNFSLSQNNEVLKIMTKAIREGYRSLKQLKYPVKPAKLILLMAFPDIFLKRKLQKFLASPMGKLLAFDHCQAAPDEMEEIAGEFQNIINQSSMKRENLDTLYSVYKK